MPRLRQEIRIGKVEDVVALAISDIHFSAKAPVARSLEPDWFEAMRRPFKELVWLNSQFDGDLPILIPGDIFDKWNPSPEVINFAMDVFKSFDGKWTYTVPGNHDLPYHNPELIDKSAYNTMIRADLFNGCDMASLGTLRIALNHQYIWKDAKTKVPGMDNRTHASKYNRSMKRDKIDVGVFGDNHHPFIHKRAGTSIINCGCFIRRKIDEREIRPIIGMIHADGGITPYYLDTSEDKWEEDGGTLREAEDHADAKNLIDSLTKLAEQGINFTSAVRRYSKDGTINEDVRRLLLEAIEEI